MPLMSQCHNIFINILVVFEFVFKFNQPPCDNLFCGAPNALYLHTSGPVSQAGDLRIALRQKKKVKVNRRTVDLPHIQLGKVSISQDANDNYNVLVKLSAIGKLWLVCLTQYLGQTFGWYRRISLATTSLLDLGNQGSFVRAKQVTLSS